MNKYYVGWVGIFGTSNVLVVDAASKESALAEARLQRPCSNLVFVMDEDEWENPHSFDRFAQMNLGGSR